jgi:hypothetical protein
MGMKELTTDPFGIAPEDLDDIIQGMILVEAEEASLADYIMLDVDLLEQN